MSSEACLPLLDISLFMMKNASRLFTPDLEKASQICIRLKEMKKEKKVWVGFGKPKPNVVKKKFAVVSAALGNRNLEFGVS
jgi:hypothetical protein